MAVATSDGRTHFVYGAPAGQNQRDVKRIVISLPGHGTSAEDGYAAWSRHIVGGDWAVAELDWWDGEGEEPDGQSGRGQKPLHAFHLAVWKVG